MDTIVYRTLLINTFKNINVLQTINNHIRVYKTTQNTLQQIQRLVFFSAGGLEFS